MEPLAALSLVSNVIQIVDFSSRVVSKSSELYNSCDGRLVQHTDIAIASADLSKLTTRLSESIELLSVHKSLCEDDRALYDLCKGCVDVSNELQNGLAKLQVTGAPSRWKSLRKALKSIWSKEHISELQSSLTQYREQLDSRILMGLRSKLDVVELRQLEGFDKLDDSVRALVGALYQASAQVELQVERQAVITDASIESHVRFAEENIVKAVKTTTTTHQRGLQSVEAKLTVLHTSEAENLEGTHKSRDDVIASIASSTAASSEDHETTRDELKRQMKSAEEQIAGLREELRQIKDMIGESVRKATLSKAKPGSEQQKKLVEHTNMLYMVMVAKDVMLQSLLVRRSVYARSVRSRTHLGSDRGYSEPPHQLHKGPYVRQMEDRSVSKCEAGGKVVGKHEKERANLSYRGEDVRGHPVRFPVNDARMLRNEGGDQQSSSCPTGFARS